LGDASEVQSQEALAKSDDNWTTSRWEIWSFYIYYIGNNGLTGYDYGPSQFQNLIYRAGYDASQPPFAAPCGADSVCVLPFLGKVRNITQVILINNGICFAIQAALFLTIGAWADYGRWRPNILIFFTILAVAVGFGWLGVEEPGKWRSANVLYMLGLIAYQGSLTFWTAAFPGLARNLPEVKESARQVITGQKSIAEHAALESLQRNRLSNMSLVVSSIGEVIILAIMVGILKGINADASVDNNTRGFSAIIAFSAAAWLACAIPWFVIEKRRPGLKLPKTHSFLTIGFVQTYTALRECWKLKQTFLYLVFYFLMSDVLNTTVTVIETLQNSVVSYSTTELTYLLIVGIAAQGIGTYIYWTIQKKYKFTTKYMLMVAIFWVLILDVWGLIGVHTDRFGYKHVWEFWAFQAFGGVMISPWYSYGQTMISEVSPLSQMFLFFSLFSIVGKTSAFIGPFISSAIIDDAGGNNNMAFAFLLALGSVSMILLWLVDVPKARQECDAFVAAEERRGAFKLAQADSEAGSEIKA